MSDSPNNYGKLLNQNIKLHRIWFKQATAMIGVTCIYRAPRAGKTFDAHGELDTNYEEPIAVGCFFSEHPDQKTLKKLGWVAELQESSSLIHVPYDLPGLQVGALFIVPSGLDNAEGRVFRVISMQNSMIYPAHIVCEIAPEYASSSKRTEDVDFTHSAYTKLQDNEEDD